MAGHEKYRISPGQSVDLAKWNSSYVEPEMDKSRGKKLLKKNRDLLAGFQDRLYAADRHSLLLVFQALDAAGKDSTVKHVFRGVRPQGIGFKGFLPPSLEENRHDYLWRVHSNVPGRGMIQIFSRSHYEEVTTTRVHPEYILAQRIPGLEVPEDIGEDFWEMRFRQINDFEKMLAENGTVIVKFFLNISEKIQSKRQLKRLTREDKHWKFSEKDIREQELRKEYLDAYERAINKTTTKYAPWYIIPADRKWFMRYIVSEIILEQMEELSLEYPGLSIRDSEVEKIKRELEKKYH